MNNKRKEELYEEVRELYYNNVLSIKDLALRYGKSERTIYRWLSRTFKDGRIDNSKISPKNSRKKRYPTEIFNRIKSLKTELPYRSAPLIQKILKKDFPDNCPSISTIRKYIRDEGLNQKRSERKLGYIKFEREHANDLWQIDIAGVQTIGHLKSVYLIAILDDCSRFILSGEYFKNQKGINVLKVIRDAVLAYGRPNQILADNGTQFRNLIGDLGTKYTRLLNHLGIKPIFAKPYHPQTKGKLERWFGTVKQMFLPEARLYVKNNPNCFLHDLNRKLREWINWYNTEKPHRSLPNKVYPAKIYFDDKKRIFRPLKININWNRWLSEAARRKVNKYNEISYKSQKFMIPQGYTGLKIDVIEYDDKIEIYHRDKLLITHAYHVLPNLERQKRKLNSSGVMMFKKKPYYIDYKLAGKTVEVSEVNQGKKLLVCLHGTLLKTIDS